MSKITNKKGFSIVEAVIALSVIIIVSVTAISIVLSSITTKVNAVNISHAQGFADNIWECFKASESLDEFLLNADFSEGIELTDGENDENGNTVYTYYSEKNNFTAQISVGFSDIDSDRFSISVVDKDGEEIISFSYRKGDGI